MAGMPRTKLEPPTDEELILEELEDEDVCISPCFLTDKQIEEKYDVGQARIVIQRNDFLVPNLLEMFQKKEILDMSPSYQRRARWNDTKKSHLVESLLMNIPIPPIFLYEKDYAQYEVMDGQQRLSAIRAFFKNEFKLRNLRVWPELNGRDFRDLPPKIRRGLERRGLAAVIILTESSKDPKAAMQIRHYVFERLNTGGERLNPQEIRNCLYASSFNNMLIQVSRDKLFTSAWAIPPKESGEPHQVSRKLAKNSFYAKMADCELALRYFALSDLAKFRGGMKRTLDDCMIRNQGISAESNEAKRIEYLSVLKLATTVYQGGLFKLLKNGSLSGRKSVPLADAVLIAFRQHLDSQDKVLAAASKIVKMTQNALGDTKSYALLVGKGNTKKAIDDRLKLMRDLVATAIQ